MLRARTDSLTLCMRTKCEYSEADINDSSTDDLRWEDLEEKPVEGQWSYFERGTHTPTTQAR